MQENEVKNLMWGGDWYRKNIIDAVNSIDDIWILRELYKMILHITKEGD